MKHVKHKDALSMTGIIRHLNRQKTSDTSRLRPTDKFINRRFHKNVLTVTAEITGMDAMGDLLARPMDAEEAKHIPQITLIADHVKPPVGIGDIVRLRVHALKNNQYEGEALKRISAQQNKLVGVFENGFFTPTDRRLKRTFKLAKAPDTLKNGDLVMADIPSSYDFDTNAVFVQKLGNLSDSFAPTLIALNNHNLSETFPESVLKEARRFTVPATADKTHPDKTHIPFVTIDGSDARDFDDAVFAEQDPDPQNKNGWHVMVAIADVAYYVRPGSALDKEAYRRGNSVYFPDRVVPMLPFELSAGVCSLNPNEKRYALICDLKLDKNGDKISHTFKRALICSKHRLTYDRVQAMLNRELPPPPGLEAELAALESVYHLLARRRRERGVLNIDVPERQITLTATGHVARIALREQTDSMKLIEELMILANVAAAEILEEKKAPVMYRVHDRPSLEKIETFNHFLQTLPIPIKAFRQASDPVAFNALLNRFDNRAERFAVNESVLRTQSQACYTPDNIGHFGLALTRYAHFTSPIRRYADVMVHRALIRALHLGIGGLTQDEEAIFTDIGEHISHTERQAASAERDAADRYVSLFMQDKIGAVFEAIVASVTEFGLFVRTNDSFADGFVPLRALTDDFYDFDVEHQTLIGRNGGCCYRLGDRVQVILREASPLTGGLIFSIKHPNRKHPSKQHKKKR